jgi:hypothetical protein
VPYSLDPDPRILALANTTRNATHAFGTLKIRLEVKI